MRNRICDHRTARAGDLVPHPLNWRTHPEGQRRALEALYEEVGFARSLLAYERPDGRLQLIDGHLRRDMTPDEEVTVEVLDVTDAEANKLLLSLDPLAALAGADEDALAELRRAADTDDEDLQRLWGYGADASPPPPEPADGPEPDIAEQYLILVTCPDEAEQARLLEQFAADGIECKSLSGYPFQ